MPLFKRKKPQPYKPDFMSRSNMEYPDNIGFSNEELAAKYIETNAMVKTSQRMIAEIYAKQFNINLETVLVEMQKRNYENYIKLIEEMKLSVIS